MHSSVSASDLRDRLASQTPPIVIDVRKAPAFHGAADMISGALRRDPAEVGQWAATLPRGSTAVVYCVHGHEVSQGAAKALTAAGIASQYLEGGIEEGWRAAGGEIDAKPVGAGTRWVTRERPKIDRIACPWLVSRFVDAGAEFLYVPAGDVLGTARERGAVPYDVAGVHFTHEGDLCSFDAFIRHYRLGGDPALARLALIVRGADTGRHELASESPGLLAMSLGLSRTFPVDLDMLRQGLVLYDALYAWSRDGIHETHTWNVGASR